MVPGAVPEEANFKGISSKARGSVWSQEPYQGHFSVFPGLIVHVLG